MGGQALAQPNNVFEVVDVRAVACDDELLEDCDEVTIEVDKGVKISYKVIFMFIINLI